MAAPGWADADGDGCNTREEVLSESVTPAQVGPGCKILASDWEDRYTAGRLTSPADVQIEHLVALSDASLDNSQHVAGVAAGVVRP